MATGIPEETYDALTENRDLLSLQRWSSRRSPACETRRLYDLAGFGFIYVGIAGRGLDLTMEHKKMRGIKDRLDSHLRGRRSGGFGVYVCDRLVLPTLNRAQIKEIAAGGLSLDALTKDYIREHLSYRFALMPNYTAALDVESRIARGETPMGLPLLNPRRPAKATAGAVTFPANGAKVTPYFAAFF